jgi:hypothetical protein
MMNSSSETYHKELDRLSHRLKKLRQDFREHGMISSADAAVLDRVQREKESLAAKLSDAEHSGHWDLFKGEFSRVWNSFVVDLDMLEVRLWDNEMIKQQGRH